MNEHLIQSLVTVAASLLTVLLVAVTTQQSRIRQKNDDWAWFRGEQERLTKDRDRAVKLVKQEAQDQAVRDKEAYLQWQKNEQQQHEMRMEGVREELREKVRKLLADLTEEDESNS